ncbi:MAG: gamma carbonic anhydrase family protein [Candidatus Cloacimonetes bacterium]|jgi:carbonic anhydrase/acetyltransferase-like protein (isoleucine patch superfamily)|nr:gamma carbonic anhydrase family protein [Candidatus Cloacimonadota bacterium]
MIKDYLQYSPKIGKKTWIAENATIIGECKIGNDCGVWFGAIIRGDVNFITIGDRSNIQDGCIIHVTQSNTKNRDDGVPTIIGNDVTVGHGVTLHGCKIGNACLIGMSATLLDGCDIGSESIVAAGSLVTKNKKFHPKSMIMGTPAKVIRQLNDDEVLSIYESAKHYVSYKNDYLKMDK